MKTLYLLRHADASLSQGQDDINRPLSEKGEQDAHHLGEIMLREGLIPDHVYCSSAKRTQMTLDALNLTMKATANIHKELYSGTVSDYINLLKETEETALSNNILLIGHNPSIHETALFLSQHKDDVRLLSYAPCTLMILKTNITHWADLSPAHSTIHCVIPPNSHRPLDTPL